MRHTASALIGICVGAALLSATPQARQVSSDTEVIKAFKPGGVVSLDLGAGEYRISGTREDQLRITWTTRRPEDLRRVRVAADVRGTAAHIRTSGPHDGFRVTIEIPQRSDLDLDLSAGELQIVGVEGNKSVSVWAGEITVDVGKAELYRQVDATVRVGEIQARPFGRSTGGIFRSLHWSGGGRYSFKASLFAGELRLRE